jgi:hypothetical protein
MAYGIVHYFPGGSSDQYEASIAALHRAMGACQTVRSSTPPALQRAAGRSRPSTTRRRAGSGSVTLSSFPGCSRYRGWVSEAPHETTIDVYKVMP